MAATTGFRPYVKLVLEPGSGARIVDEQGQRTLTVTPTEGRLLALLMPSSTAEGLATVARAAGLDIEARQVEALLVRLQANGFLDYTPPEGTKKPLAPLPDDVVPCFRADLGVAAGPRAGLALVTDKRRDRSFTLYDFEVHIARLLDGRHTVSQVIELAAKIGIPMTPVSLGKFIDQMKAYGFVVDGPQHAAPDPVATWPARNQWSPEIRELYQSALRQFRQGRPGHALEYLDALLEIQPDTPEAIELKARVEAHLDAGPVTELSFEDLHGVDEPVPELVAAAEPLLPQTLSREVPLAPLELSLPTPEAPKPVEAPPPVAEPPVAEPPVAEPPVAEPPPPAVEPPPPPSASPEPPEPPAPVKPPEPAPVPAPVPQEEVRHVPPPEPSPPSPPPPEPPKRKPRRWPLVLAAGVVLVVGAAFPIPATERFAVQLEPVVTGTPKIPAGIFGALKVQPGTKVESGAVLAVLETTKLNAEKDELEKTAARLESNAARASVKPKPADVKKAKATLAKAKKDLAKVQAQKKKGKPLSQAEAAVEKAQKAVDALEGGAERAKAMRADAAAAKEKAGALQKQIDAAFVTAPAAGVFELEQVPPTGAQFDDGTPFGRIVEPVVLVKGAPADLRDGTLTVGARKVEVATLERRGDALVLPLDASARPGNGEVERSSGLRPWPMVKLLKR